MNLKCNCCDGIYNSFDVHFTSSCDNKCTYCIDAKYDGTGIIKPDVDSIVNTIIKNQQGFNDVLFLGGEPCLYLDELLECITQLRKKTNLKLYTTTSVPITCYNNYDTFTELINSLDGINLSVQHYREDIADKIRGTISQYDRQSFYQSLPYKEKIRLNINIVKPFLYIKEDLINCLKHYDHLKFASIRLSELQHGRESYTSFSEIFNLNLKSPYANGCQIIFDMKKLIPKFSTKLILKQSCFLCEHSKKASFSDGLKMITKIFKKNEFNYGVIYENGSLMKGWI